MVRIGAGGASLKRGTGPASVPPRRFPCARLLTLLGLPILGLTLQGAGPLVGKIEGGTVVDLGLGETAPLPDVTVTLIYEDQNRERKVTTGTDGQYVFQNLPLGDYTVEPHKDGYRVRGSAKADATVNIDQTDVVLPPFHLVPIGG